MPKTGSKKGGRKKSRASGASGSTSTAGALAAGASTDADLMDGYFNASQLLMTDQAIAEEVAMSEESEDDELPVLPRPSIPDSELSPQYWLLLKVVKYIKVTPHAKVCSIFILTGAIYSKVWEPNGDPAGPVRPEPLRRVPADDPAGPGTFRSHRRSHQRPRSRRSQVQSISTHC